MGSHDGLEARLRPIEQLAEQALATDDYPVPEGKDTFVQSLGRELRARCQDLRGWIDDLEPREAACWMHDLLGLAEELQFTMADEDARRIGMGGVYRNDEAVAAAAHTGRLFLRGHGSSKRALTARIEELLRDNRDWSNRRLRVALEREGELAGDWSTGTFTYHGREYAASYVGRQLLSLVRNRLGLPARSRSR